MARSACHCHTRLRHCAVAARARDAQRARPARRSGAETGALPSIAPSGEVAWRWTCGSSTVAWAILQQRRAARNREQDLHARVERPATPTLAWQQAPKLQTWEMRGIRDHVAAIELAPDRLARA